MMEQRGLLEMCRSFASFYRKYAEFYFPQGEIKWQALWVMNSFEEDSSLKRHCRWNKYYPEQWPF